MYEKRQIEFYFLSARFYEYSVAGTNFIEKTSFKERGFSCKDDIK